MHLSRIYILLLLLLLCPLSIFSQNNWKKILRTKDAAFYATPEAQRIGDQLLLYQRVTGGWPKNIDMTRQLTDEEKAQVLAEKNKRSDSTTDNDATVIQMGFLARLYQATGKKEYRDAFGRAVDYLLSGQYANGGWPQFWPEMHGYQVHITYNDDAMANTMMLLKDIADEKKPYNNQLTDQELRSRAQQAYDKGVECILNTQIVVDGKPTVWCQQHDRETLQPAPARAFELASYCSQESAWLVKILMLHPNPNERIIRAVNGAMEWFEQHKIMGYRLVRTGKKGEPDYNTQLVADSTAGPLWARFYDFEHVQPFVCDRDGVPRAHLEDIGAERRNGYSWYNDRPSLLYPIYEQWKEKNKICFIPNK